MKFIFFFLGPEKEKKQTNKQRRFPKLTNSLSPFSRAHPVLR